jgi:hypothetical protein
MKLLPGLPPTERDQLARFALAFAAIIVGWAIAHDLYLIHVEPRHFTEYHRPLLPISDLRLLALQYATVATLGPGLLFGALAYAACRAGRGARLRLRPVALGFAGVIAAGEALILALGRYSFENYKAGSGPLYPLALYPDTTDGILYSQSVNISAYLVAPVLGAAYLATLALFRPRGAPPAGRAAAPA